MKIQHIDFAQDKISSKQVELPPSIFSVDYNASLVHQLVTTYLENQRQWSKRLKGRSDVSGGGAKPWRQKGTGRARAGTSNSPLWRSGGVTFAHKHTASVKRINKKMYRAGMKCILSELFRQDRLYTTDEIKLDTHKTKDFNAKYQKLELKNTLFILGELNNTIVLATRNIPGVKFTTSSQVNPVDLVKYQNVVMDLDSINNVQEWLS